MEYDLRDESGVRIVEPRGPIDVSRSLALRELLGQLIGGAHGRVLLDLSGVTLIDSSGVGVLITAHRRAEQAGVAFGLAGPNASVSRVFELTRTDRLLRIFPDVGEGVAGLGGAQSA